MKLRLFSILLLIGTYIFFFIFFQLEKDENQIAERIELTINSISSAQEEAILMKLNNINQTFSTAVVHEHIDLFNLAKDDGAFLEFIFLKDSLVYWNSRIVDPTEISSFSSEQNSQVIKLSNGWFQKFSITSNDLKIVSLYPIYLTYSIQNSLLPTGFNASSFSFASAYEINETSNIGFPLNWSTNSDVFLVKKTNHYLSSKKVWYDLSLLILGLVILSMVYRAIYLIYRKITVKNKYSELYFALYILDIVILQILLRAFQNIVFGIDNELFNNRFFIGGQIFPSLGILILHTHAFFHIALAFFTNRNQLSTSVNIKLVPYYTFVVLFIFIVNFFTNVFILEKLYYNSSLIVSGNQDLIQIGIGLLIILFGSLFHLSSLLISYKLLLIVEESTIAKILKTLMFLFLILLAAFIGRYISAAGSTITIYAIFFYSIFLFTRYKSSEKENLKIFSITIVFFASLMMTLLLYQSNEKRTIQELQLTAHKLGEENDPLFEFLIPDILKDIENDTVINRMVASKHDTLDALEWDEELNSYLRARYFSDYFLKYSMDVTVCSPDQNLVIQPNNYTIQCDLFFNDLIALNGHEIISDRLYIIDDNVEGLYYLFVLPLPAPAAESKGLNIYMEFYFKYIPEGLGYPDLLIDQSKIFTKNFADYSFANYYSGILNYKFGSFFYPTLSEQLLDNQKEIFKHDGYIHHRYDINDFKVLIVSKKTIGLIGIIAPFSYFLILFAFLSIITAFVINKKFIFNHEPYFSFRIKLQLILIASLLLSFIIIGVSSTYYITGIYKSKNKDFLTEKTQSILIELEHKLKNEDLNEPGMKEYLQQLLMKFSLVFFSDINLYNTNGSLMATSRPEIFKQNLMAPIMDPTAFKEMHFGRKIFFIQEEHIGNSSYMSSYIPFKNAAGEAVAYINLPFFARESEVRSEISTLILTYLNIFLLLAAMAVALALLLSRRLTQPLEMIQQKMRLVRFDKINEKIIWNSRDEIGQLVNQYNNLLDQLQESAELLAKSERESAWREMAKQVAHEIKNPLTPMRLSIQYLERAWNDNDPEIDTKIKNTTQTIINQIDTLSSIATAFSDFAKMPVNKPSQLNVIQHVQETILLFNSHEGVTFKLIDLTQQDLIVNIDKDSFRRALTNLIKNSIQAIGRNSNGWIHIEISEKDGNCQLIVSDNGKGMSEDEKVKVFTPNFTTKSSGMGLGLSMVKNIIETAGGTITFSSVEQEGSSFVLTLPLMSKSID